MNDQLQIKLCTYNNKDSCWEELCYLLSNLLPRAHINSVVSEVLTGRVVSSYYLVLAL